MGRVRRLNRERRLGGLGRTRDKLQYVIQLVLQQQLVVCHRFHKGSDAFVDCQHVLGTHTGQGSKDKLQMFTPGVENVAQGKLFHGNTRDYHS